MSDPIGRLYRETGHFVLRRCVQVLGDPEEAMDATQWTYLRAIETGFVVHSRGEALSWLYRTATRRCLWILRNRATRTRLSQRYAGDLAGMPPTPIEGDVIGRDLVRRALRGLDDQTAEIAIFCYLMGFGNDRVAELCGVSVRTVGRGRAAFEAALHALTAEEAS